MNTYFDRTVWDETIPDSSNHCDTWTYIIYNPDGTITLSSQEPPKKESIFIHQILVGDTVSHKLNGGVGKVVESNDFNCTILWDRAYSPNIRASKTVATHKQLIKL